MKPLTALLLFPTLIWGMVCRAQTPQKAAIKAGELFMYYERAGKGKALVLLHAGLQDHTMWQSQVKALSASYDVITPDLPFHGQTKGIDTILLAAEAIKILLDSLHLQKVSIAGLSMGAAIAQDFIIAYPNRVDKAFLISAGINGLNKIHPIDSISMAWYQQFTQALDRQDTVGAAVEFTKAWAEGIYRSHDSLKAPVSQYVYRTTLANLRLHKMERWPVLQEHPPAIEKLSSIHVPVLIIDGDKDLPYITVSSAYLEKNISGARRVVMKDVAHMLNMEKPAELNKLMIDYLEGR